MQCHQQARLSKTLGIDLTESTSFCCFLYLFFSFNAWRLPFFVAPSLFQTWLQPCRELKGPKVMLLSYKQSLSLVRREPRPPLESRIWHKINDLVWFWAWVFLHLCIATAWRRKIRESDWEMKRGGERSSGFMDKGQLGWHSLLFPWVWFRRESSGETDKYQNPTLPLKSPEITKQSVRNKTSSTCNSPAYFQYIF